MLSSRRRRAAASRLQREIQASGDGARDGEQILDRRRLEPAHLLRIETRWLGTWLASRSTPWPGWNMEDGQPPGKKAAPSPGRRTLVASDWRTRGFFAWRGTAH